MTYKEIMSDKKNIQPFCMFHLATITYENGFCQIKTPLPEFFIKEITDDGRIIRSFDIDDSLVFTDDDIATDALKRLVSAIRNTEFNCVYVQEYDELHNRSSLCMHYPNEYYGRSGFIQPVTIYHNGPGSRVYEEATRNIWVIKNTELNAEIIGMFELYNKREMTYDEYKYLDACSIPKKQQIIVKNRGTGKFNLYITERR